MTLLIQGAGYRVRGGAIGGCRGCLLILSLVRPQTLDTLETLGWRRLTSQE